MIERLLGVDDLMRIFGSSRISIYKKVGESRAGRGDFPLPVFGKKHRLRWRVADIEQYTQTKVSASVQQGLTEEPDTNFNNYRGNKEMKNHPMQNIILDENGNTRFQENAIVVYLLKKSGISLSDLALMDFTDEDHMQFAQLLGYPVYKYVGISQASDKSVTRAIEKAERLKAANV